jgi:hypothetical protein
MSTEDYVDGLLKSLAKEMISKQTMRQLLVELQDNFDPNIIEGTCRHVEDEQPVLMLPAGGIE